MPKTWTLDYDGGLFMQIPPEDTDNFSGSAFFKLSLKRYVQEVLYGFIRFKCALNYIDYKRVIDICQRESLKNNSFVNVTHNLSDYIEAKEIHIDKRSKLGIEIKNRDAKYQTRFSEYREIVDSFMTRRLRDQQMWDSFFMFAMQKSGNFSVPGSGKTASVMGLYTFLKYKELVNRIVVICPKNAFGSWVDEFGYCFEGKDELHYFNIHSSEYTKVTQRRKAIKYESGNCNLFLFNYEAVGTYRNEIESLIGQNTLLIFDEVHRVKRIDGKNASNSVFVSKNAKYIVTMTGTPIPNTYLDIYNLLHILFPEEYNEFFDFQIAMLRNPTADEISNINAKLQPFFCRTTKQQLAVPDANDDNTLSVPSSQPENSVMDILRLKYRKNKLALMIRILQLESNPLLLLEKLDLSEFQYILDDRASEQMIDYVDYSVEIESLIRSCGTPAKFEKCVELAELLANQGKRVIIWCIFVDSINRLSKALETRGIRTKCIYGEVPLEERQQIINAYKNGDFQVLLTNPHTLAESVSLHSACHDAIYFEYSYNLVHLLQSKDRIHRLGLPDGQYTQYYFMQTVYPSDDGFFSMDEQIYLRLKDKEKTMLDAIENNVLETLPTSEEDLNVIFSKLFDNR